MAGFGEVFGTYLGDCVGFGHFFGGTWKAFWKAFIMLNNVEKTKTHIQKTVNTQKLLLEHFEDKHFLGHNSAPRRLLGTRKCGNLSYKPPGAP